MKKKLLFFIICLMTVSFANAQLTSVALVGNGTLQNWPNDPQVDTAQLTSTDGENWTVTNVTLLNGAIKFRGNNSWALPYNWGGTDFPSGTAIVDGPAITSVAGIYNVTFNSTSGAYNFILQQNVFQVISIIGDASPIVWGDTDMTTTDGNLYTLRATLGTGALKFRGDHSWNLPYNWGGTDFPSGTAVVDADGIIIPTAGTYDITFNKTTLAYSIKFKVISIIGEAAPGGWVDTDMTTTDGNLYTLRATLGTGQLKFRGDHSWTLPYNWGGTDFPSGTAVVDADGVIIPTAGIYDITFNVTTATYSIIRTNDNEWTGASDTNWNNLSNWSNGIPINTSNVIIKTGVNQPVITTNVTINSLVIETSGSLTVTSGNNLTITDFINTAGTMTVENNANLIQANNVANIGDVTVNRSGSVLSRLDYTLWSSPVASQNLLAFSPNTTLTRFYTYNPGTNVYNAIVDPSTTNFTAANGYLIRMPNTALDYPLNQTFNGAFKGVPNNGNISLTNLTSNSYYAVGNPYPSTLSAASFLSGNSTDGVLYFWRKTNAASGTAYATYTAGGATTTSPTSAAPNGSIQVGQGFIVKTSATATALDFTNAMREVSPTSTQFFKTKNVVQKDRIWLNLTNPNGVFSQALLVYMDGATQGVDAGIDGEYINDSPVALTSNINGREYTIQGRPTFDSSDIVPLNFKTDVAGDYTIAIDHTDGLFAAGQDVYLVDNTARTETNLKTDAYTFTATAGLANSRFTLKYQKTLKVNAPTFNDNNVTIYKNNGILYVNSVASVIKNIKVYDIQGSLIAEQTNVNANSATVKHLNVGKKVLIVQVTSFDNRVVNKKVIN